MSVLIFVGLNEMTALKIALTTKPVRINATRTTPNVSIPVPVQPNVRLVVTNALRHFVNAETLALVLIIKSARKGSF